MLFASEKRWHTIHRREILLGKSHFFCDSVIGLCTLGVQLVLQFTALNFMDASFYLFESSMVSYHNESLCEKGHSSRKATPYNRTECDLIR